MTFYDLSVNYLVPLLYFLAAAGIAWALGEWIAEMSRTYREVYIEETGRHLDDMFLSLNPQQVMTLAQIAGLAAALPMFGLAFNSEALGRVAGEVANWLMGGAMAGELVVQPLHLFFAALFALIFGGLGFMIPRWIIRRMRQKRLELFNEQLVEAMQTMSNSLRAGFSVLQAIDMVVKENRRPISEEFGLFMHQHRLGVKFEEAMDSLGKRVGSQDLDLMITAIEISRQTGGNLTEVFDQLASVIRERMRVEGKIRSLTAQGRLQAIIVGFMPLLLATAMYFISPAMMTGFVFSTTGLIMIVMALTFEICGYLVIRKIVNIDI